MWDIIWANEGMWINILIPFLIGVYLVFTHKEYALVELLAQVGLTVSILFGVFYLFFEYTTDLYSDNYYNSYVKHFEHYDDYTSRESYSCGGKIKRTCYRNVYHPDEYYAVTGTGDQISISSSNWSRAVSEFGKGSNSIFGGPKVRFSQSWGGSEYFSIPKKKIPASSVHSELNYVHATASNIVRAKTSDEEILRCKKNNTLKDYPVRVYTEYGKLRLNRILGNSRYNSEQLKALDFIAADLGISKQVNPLIYVVEGESRAFTHTLRSYWKGGRKNDAILILGIKDGKVEWSDTIAWTKDVDFLVNATKIYKGKTLDEVIPVFRAEIVRYFKRTNMKEYKHLEDEISLSFAAQAFILLINLIGSFFLFRKFLTN